MNYTMIVWDYVILVFSFFCVYAAIKQGSRIWLYMALLIYIVTVGLYSFLMIGEVITPSEDANIGLGGAMLLMDLVSFAGIIFAVITYLVRKRKAR